ncbi:hypothetical protein [Microbacterium azadirachtae]|uniref:Alternate signal-mediated exported protein, RER_14450 family n=1 Tax=Microbacterium azadirachtae TaxID=582680 RepID=A0A0F0L4B9_9MICO|nr:hypothetical protein [Microbacterium azadirachtae]KJL26371.1 hypothetical protein RL72_01087 [Microbacterium azadirachtae]UXW85203.1 hypothetical protein NFX31_13415 [Microbacterium azadirachtae]SDM41804.1 hypothetical protein SAMN04488593_3482 [Microbacterium azadirachtae]SEG57858.1 hypothetical protein SAMN04488594_3607 [Microbacterium azadirachtae]SEG60858.1 hypothetical protein SAMN04488592_3618 [Microbacterium azadirachtae]
MTENKNIQRRAVLKGAAWSVPVVAAAVATPLAAASTANASIAWNGSSTSLLTLALLDGGGTLTAQVLITVPTQYTVTNGTGPLTGAATVTIAVGRPAGINIPVGQARGFGVASVDGINTTAGERTTTYQTAPIVGSFGFPATSWTGTRTVTVASNGTLNVPVVFGLAGVSTGVAISALATFPVTLTVVLNGRTFTSSTSISVPVGAGIL